MKSLVIVAVSALAAAVMMLHLFALRATIVPLPMPTSSQSAEIVSKQRAHLRLGTEAQKLSREDELIDETAPGSAEFQIDSPWNNYVELMAV